MERYCIYCYTNKINGKKYVGQTCHTLEERAGKDGCHYVIKNGAFGNAIQKYGWDSFIPEVLEDGLSLEEANDREEYWIRELDTLVPNGYNLAGGGRNHIVHPSTGKKISQSNKGRKVWNKGKKMSEEYCRKMSDARKGKKMWPNGRTFSEEHKRHISESRKGWIVPEEIIEHRKEVMTNNVKTSKKVCQYSLDGQFVGEYPSIAEASRQTGYSHSHICEACKGKLESAGGYIWRYKEVA